MRHIYYLIAFAALFIAWLQPACAQGYDPNQYAQQQNYQQPAYQQYNGIPQTTPNYGQAYAGGGYQQQAGGYQQQQYGGQQQYGQPQLQQQYAQYGQMPQAPVYYGQAQQTAQAPSWPNNAAASQPDNTSQPSNSPGGSFLNDMPNLPTPPDDKTITETPNGGPSKTGAVLKGAGGMLGKMIGGAGKVAAPAAQMYLMNKATGGRIRYVMPAPMMPMPGMGMGYGGMNYGYNPYMGSGMRSMTGW